MAGGKRQAKTKKKAPARPKGPARARKPSAPAKRAALVRPKARPAAVAPSRPGPAARAAKAAPTLDKLYQVALTAKNLDASVAFYRDVLGLRFIARFDPPGLAFFSLGSGARLMLSATASEATLYFLVDDLKAAFREFQSRGVHFLQPPAMIHRDEAGEFGKKGVEEWMAFFRDPSGNMLALVEKR
jgi:catechol 2,3-dioxygenase-like lactoylglutathione lyase family enzyme